MWDCEYRECLALGLSFLVLALWVAPSVSAASQVGGELDIPARRCRSAPDGFRFHLGGNQNIGKGIG